MNIIECFLSLSQSLDFTHSGLMNHHHRTALIALNIGKSAGLADCDLLELFQASIIHDIGTINWKEKADLIKFDIDAPWGHCSRGSEMVHRHSSLRHLSPIILSHHDHWSGSNSSGLSKDRIPLPSRIIHLADRTDILIKPNQNILDQSKTILNKLRSQSGVLFDPDLVAVFEQLAQKNSFWFDLASAWEDDCLKELLPFQLIPDELAYSLDIAQLFATVVDTKSPFTYRHSRGVAAIAGFMGEQSGFSPAHCSYLKIAGLLHDLGKLSVPDELLEKPGKLSTAEFNIMKQHAYYTYRLLKPIPENFPLAEWAAFHHEKPNGKGYPFGKNAAELDLSTRLISIADLFVALREDRPYRASMSWEQIAGIMNELAQSGDLDKDRISIILDNQKLLDQKWEELSER